MPTFEVYKIETASIYVVALSVSINISIYSDSSNELCLLSFVAQAYLMTDSLRQFALVGESAASNSAVKQLRIIASAPPPALDGRLKITVNVTQDTAAHMKST